MGEMANQKAYEELKAAKEEEIKAGQAQIDSKTQELADTDEKNAQAKEDVEDTKKSLSADEQFLMMLKEKCSMTDGEWEERQKTRQLEMEACSKALAVLSSDDAHDLFTKTFNPSLVQKESAMHSERRAQASALLSSVARKVQNPRLATLAVRVRLDAFTRVKKAIDDMVSQLLKEKEDEIKHKDFCVEEFNTNELQTEKKERAKADLTAKIEEMANQKAYEDLKAAKEEEIKAGQAQIDTKTQELATTDEKNAQAKEDVEDTKKSLSADEQFLMMLKEKCSMTDGEWEERQKTRQLEMEACSKALAVLSSDDAHDLFTKTFNPSFAQRESSMHSERRTQASKLLSAVAQKTQNPRLATLAVRVRLDAFTRVKKAIDDMVSQLLKEKEAEIKHNDFCVEEFNTNEL